MPHQIMLCKVVRALSPDALPYKRAVTWYTDLSDLSDLSDLTALNCLTVPRLIACVQNLQL